LIQLKIHYKYDPRRAILLDPMGESITVDIDRHSQLATDKEFNGYFKFQGIKKWVKGMNLDEEQNFLCCWSTTKIFLYNFTPN
jgi:hypothetical protein